MEENYQFKVMEITPDYAREVLSEHNNGNRPLNKNTVSFYASQMRAGKWMVNGQSIVFDPDGELLDGQHRLAAVIQADTAIVATVIIGISKAAFTTIDQNRVRTASDVLAIAGVPNYTNIAAGIAKYFSFCKLGNVNYTGGNLKQLGKSKTDVYQECMERQLIWQSLYKMAASCDKKFRAATMSFIMGFSAYVIFEKGHTSDQCAAFFKSLANGTDYPNPTIEELRNKIIKSISKRDSMNDRYKQAIIIKTWNAYITGRVLKNIQWDQSREQFPEIR